MNTRELRIGNYYNKIYNGVNQGILKLDSFYLCEAINNQINLQPIRFYASLWEDVDSQTNIFADRAGFIIFKNGHEFLFSYDDCEHLHELQNLYFALTKKELNIKL